MSVKKKDKTMVNLPDRALYHWLGEYLVCSFAVKFYAKYGRFPKRIGGIKARKNTIIAYLD